MQTDLAAEFYVPMVAMDIVFRNIGKILRLPLELTTIKLDN